MPRPIPLVLHLQGDALNPDMPAASLLRRAKVVATKLGVKDALVWIDRELGGYPGTDNADLPTYRKLRGQPKFLNPVRGWCPLGSPDPDMMLLLSATFITESIAAIERLIEGKRRNIFHCRYPDDLRRIILEHIEFDTEVVVAVGHSQMWNIVDRVRTLVVEWTLELETAGVLGEGMSFTLTEKEKAASVTNNYFAQNMGVAGDVSGHAQVHNQQVAAAGLDLAKVQDLVTQLREMASILPAGTRDAVAAQLQALAEELDRPEPEEGRLRGLLSSVRAACEGAAGNLIASGAVEAIKKLLAG